MKLILPVSEVTAEATVSEMGLYIFSTLLIPTGNGCCSFKLCTLEGEKRKSRPVTDENLLEANKLVLICSLTEMKCKVHVHNMYYVVLQIRVYVHYTLFFKSHIQSPPKSSYYQFFLFVVDLNTVKVMLYCCRRCTPAFINV